MRKKDKGENLPNKNVFFVIVKKEKTLNIILKLLK
jgi:hypothetical protein